ncbi:MAG: hypothetical protein AAB408_00885 [Patescibacteria group bacterium]
MDYKKHPEHLVRWFITAPFIYAVLPATLLADLIVEIYHRVCFPLYGIPKVNRAEYIVFDRAKLQYLNWFDKLNCTYCSYVNGWVRYAAEIAGRTEKYWCGIRNRERAGYHEPAHHKNFLTYGDEEGYRTFGKGNPNSKF